MPLHRKEPDLQLGGLRDHQLARQAEAKGTERFNAAYPDDGIERRQTPRLVDQLRKSYGPPAGPGILRTRRDMQRLVEKELDGEVVLDRGGDHRPQHQVDLSFAQVAIVGCARLQDRDWVGTNENRNARVLPR